MCALLRTIADTTDVHRHLPAGEDGVAAILQGGLADFFGPTITAEVARRPSVDEHRTSAIPKGGVNVEHGCAEQGAHVLRFSFGGCTVWNVVCRF